MDVLFASHLYPCPDDPLKGVFVSELARALAALCAVSVAAPLTWDPRTHPRRPPCSVRREGPVTVYHPFRLPTPRPLDALRWRAHRAALSKMPDHGPWQIIHSHWIDPDATAVLRWRPARGTIQVATIHGHAALGKGTIARPSPRIAATLRALDHVFTVSSELRQMLVDEFLLDPARVSVHFNGIDPSRFYLADRAAARRQLGLPLDRPIILTVARLSPEKDLSSLIHALHLTPDRNLEWHVLGDGSERDKLGQLAEDLRLADRCFFHGGVPHHQLLPWFSAADLFCLPSLHEGCPVVVLEALASGLPVLASRVGAIPDLVTPALGMLFDPRDTSAIAAALTTGLARTWDRPTIAAQGASHTWQRAAQHLYNRYQTLLDP
jgi:teichuronic acid biosynthesis glycosyltransferase TuaC